MVKTVQDSNLIHIGARSTYKSWDLEGTEGITQFYGYPETSVSSVTPVITINSSPDQIPKVLSVSAKDTTAVGTRLQSSKSLRPYEDLMYVWTLTYSDDSAVVDNESIVDPRDNSARNPYVSVVGPEADFVLREARGYKITLNVYYMTSTMGEVSKVTTSTTVTPVNGTHSRLFFDGANGNNSNDGLDPFGFALTTASFTHSTRELTQSGAFTSYNHANATSGDHTGRYNYIYIDLAGFEGLYEIESKTDNDTIVLATSLGSNQSNVTSSDGPKLSFDGDSASDTLNCFSGSGGQSTESYTITTAMRQHFDGNADETANPSTIGYVGYNGRPRITTTTAGELLHIGNGGSNTPPGFVYGYNIDFDGDGNAIPMFGLNTTALTNGTKQQFFFDNCIFRRSDQGTAVNIQWTAASAPATSCLFYRCVLDGLAADTGRADSAHAVFSRFDNIGWQRWVACTYDTDSDNIVLDHFHYPNGTMNHFHSRWNHYRTSVTQTSYCMNNNNAITGHTAEHLCIAENFMSDNAEWGIDFSNSNNDVTDKQFENVVVIANKSNVVRGFSLHYSLTSGFFGYNDMYKNNQSDHQIWNGGGTGFVPADYQQVICGNRNYGGSLFNLDDGQHLECLHNEHQRDTGTIAGVVDPADLPGGSDVVIDDNNFYTSAGAELTVDGSSETISTWNTNNSASNTTNNPAWNDPVNGDFDGNLNEGFPVTEV